MKRFVLAVFILVQFTHASVEAVMYCDWQQSFQPISCSDIIKIVCANTLWSLRNIAVLMNLTEQPLKAPVCPAKYPARHSRNQAAIIVHAARIGEDNRNPLKTFAYFAPLRAPAIIASSYLFTGVFITMLALCMCFFRFRLNAWLARAVFGRAYKTLNVFMMGTLIAAYSIQGFLMPVFGGALCGA